MTAGEKLVRDKIPEMERRKGNAGLFRTATPEEGIVLLRKKIVEECQELLAAHPDDVPGEVADVIEAALAYAEACGYTQAWCDVVRQRKLDERGGFRQRQVMRLG